MGAAAAAAAVALTCNHSSKRERANLALPHGKDSGKQRGPDSNSGRVPPSLIEPGAPVLRAPLQLRLQLLLCRLRGRHLRLERARRRLRLSQPLYLVALRPLQLLHLRGSAMPLRTSVLGGLAHAGAQLAAKPLHGCATV